MNAIVFTMDAEHDNLLIGRLEWARQGFRQRQVGGHRRNVSEIIGIFGGADQLRSAMNQLQTLLYVV